MTASLINNAPTSYWIGIVSKQKKEVKLLKTENENFKAINDELRTVNVQLREVNKLLRKQRDELFEKKSVMEIKMELIEQKLDQVVTENAGMLGLSSLKELLHQTLESISSNSTVRQSLSSTNQSVSSTNQSITSTNQSICSGNHDPIKQELIDDYINASETCTEDVHMNSNCSANVDNVNVSKFDIEDSQGGTSELVDLNLSLSLSNSHKHVNTKNIERTREKPYNKLKKDLRGGGNVSNVKRQPKKREPKVRRQYDLASLHMAYFLVIDKGYSISGAARECNVPRNTLRDRIKGNTALDSISCGRQPLLNMQEEWKLSEHLRSVVEWGYRLTIPQVLAMATDYCKFLKKQRPVDKDHLLGDKWYYKFVQRNNLDLKISNLGNGTLEDAEAKACSDENLKAYFDRLKECLTEHEFTPDRIYNVDEKGLYQSTLADHQKERLSSSSKTPSDGDELISMLGCGNAAGQTIPPFFIIKDKDVHTEACATIPGISHTFTSSGWSDNPCFEKYVREHFYPNLKHIPSEDHPVMLIYDGHLTLANLSLINWAAERHVILFCLSAHTSQICGPLSVACFKPVETLFTERNDAEIKRNQEGHLSTASICRFVCEIYDEALNSKNLISGFKRTGIVPNTGFLLDKDSFNCCETKFNHIEDHSKASTSLQDMPSKILLPSGDNRKDVAVLVDEMRTDSALIDDYVKASEVCNEDVENNSNDAASFDDFDVDKSEFEDNLEDSHGGTSDLVDLKFSLSLSNLEDIVESVNVVDSHRLKPVKKNGKIRKKPYNKLKTDQSDVKIKTEVTRKNKFKAKGQYGLANLHKAYYMVKDEGYTLGQASRHCNVPKTTLHDRVSGKVPLENESLGMKPYLTNEEERKLAQHLASVVEWGYRLTINEVLEIATDYFKVLKKQRPGGYPDKLLSMHWYRTFIKRNQIDLKISNLGPYALEDAQAKACTEKNLKAYFDRLKECLTEHEFSPDRIYNVDEKGLCQSTLGDHNKGPSDSSKTPSEEDELVTLLGCGNAAGQAIPPFFIFKEEDMHTEANEIVPGTSHTFTSSGWSDIPCFEKYVKEHFYPNLKHIPSEDHPVMLIYDGHLTLANLSLINWAAERHVILFCLSAHTSQICGPLNVACFKPIETLFTERNEDEMKTNQEGLSTAAMCRIVCEIYDEALSSKNLVSGFKKTGIVPFTGLSGLSRITAILNT